MHEASRWLLDAAIVAGQSVVRREQEKCRESVGAVGAVGAVLGWLMQAYACLHNARELPPDANRQRQFNL